VSLDGSQPILVRAGDGEGVIDRPERTIRILVEREELIVSWFRYGPGEKGPEPHVHRQHNDAFYVLEGELELGLGPEIERITAVGGTFAAAPPNVVHTFRNASDTTVVFLNIHAPSMGFGRVLRGGGEEGFDQFAPPEHGGRPLADAVVCLPDEGERFEREDRVLVVKAELPELSVIDLSLHRGWERVDLHRHADDVDLFFVLEGEVELLGGEEQWTQRVGPGSLVAAPPGMRHGFPIGSGDSIRLLNLHAPGSGFVASFRGG
jgi:quercetin dioxygenase-like cupin family protein